MEIILQALIAVLIVIVTLEVFDYYIDGVSVFSFPLLVFIISVLFFPLPYQLVILFIWLGIMVLKEILINQVATFQVKLSNLLSKLLPAITVLILKALGMERVLLGYPMLLLAGVIHLIESFTFLEFRSRGAIRGEERLKVALVISILWSLNLVTIPISVYGIMQAEELSSTIINTVIIFVWTVVLGIVTGLIKYYYEHNVEIYFKRLEQALETIRNYQKELENRARHIQALTLELNKTRESFSLLTKFHDVVARNWNLEELLKQLGALLLKLFDYQNFVVFRYEPNNMSLVPMYYKTIHVTRVKNMRLKLGDTIVGEAVKRMKPILWNQRSYTGFFSGSLKDFESYSEDFEPLFHTDRSVMVVPMAFNDALLGCLYIGHEQRNMYDKDKFQVFCLIGYELALIYSFYMEYSKSLNLAIRDGLTGLYTHRYFQERLEEEILKSKRYGSPVSLIMLDTDNFKKYNDTYGHPEGDKLLQRIAKYLRETLRESDVICRYGGDEFSIILPNIDKNTAIRIAQRIHARFDSVNLPGRKVRVTASIGVATFPYDATTREKLIKAADTNLYKAKQMGRNRIVAD